MTSREIEVLVGLAWEMRVAARALLGAEPESLVGLSLLRWARKLDPEEEEAPVVRLADFR